MVSPTTDRRLGLAGNTAYKTPVTAIATANIVQSGEQTIDTVAVKALNAAGVPDRVLCTGMTDATKNGIWDVSTAAWTRSIDSNGNYDLAQGTQVIITRGSSANQIWMLTTLNPITVDTTALAWSQSLSAGFLATLAAAAGSSLVGFIQSGAGAVVRTVQTKLREVYLPSVKDYGAVGDGVANDLAAIQAAYAANSDVYWPNGTYNLGNNTWTPPVAMRMVGQSRRGVKLARTGAGPLITFAINTFDPYFENIEFTGVGNTGMTVAATAGLLQGYLIRPHIVCCDFDYDLAYGINADLIYATIEKTIFGYYGVGAAPAPGASTFVAIKSYVYPATSNFTNLNTVRNCQFHFAGSLTVPAVDLSAGSNWLFDSCAWEQGGLAFAANNVQLIKFIGTNWFEGNVATNGLIQINTCSTAPDFHGINFSNNTCRSLFEYVSGASKGLKIHDCSLGMNSPSYAIFDTTTLSALLPGDGSIAFYDNLVVGGNALNKCVTGTEFRGGKTSPRLTMSGITNTPGTITDSSDPGATISFNSTGDVSISSSHPFASATNKIRAIATGAAADACRVQLVNASQVRVQLFTDAGAASDGVFSLVVYGG